MEPPASSLPGSTTMAQALLCSAPTVAHGSYEQAPTPSTESLQTPSPKPVGWDPEWFSGRLAQLQKLEKLKQMMGMLAALKKAQSAKAKATSLPSGISVLTAHLHVIATSHSH